MDPYGHFGTGGGEIKDPVHHNNAAIQNQSRTSEAAIENAKRSDAVRQFAMDWYLKDEVKKQNIQASGGQEGYPDYIYDEALHQAILKAEEYLKPFFSYDLDDLYAIEWDSAENGGSDRDKTTLSAEKLKNPRKVIIMAFRNTFLTEPMWQSSSSRIREHWKISKTSIIGSTSRKK